MSIGLFTIPDNLTEDQVLGAYVRHVLAAAGGNKTKAAAILGMDRRTLYRRLTKGL